MKIEELLHHLEPGMHVTILNKPFHYAGKARLTLDGGDVRHWLFENDGGLLAISPDDEEIVLFRPVDEELEAESGIVVYQGNDHEFSYEDAGAVSHVEGNVTAEEGDRYDFSDYESDDGEVVRLVKNDNTGDQHAYVGHMIVEDDILPAS